MLDLDDLLQQIPRLIGRLISFEAFAVYLLDERRGELRAAYSVGYPAARQAAPPEARARASSAPRSRASSRCSSTICDADPRYVEFVPGMNSEIVVPLLHKSRPIGALNILSRNRDQFTPRRRRHRPAVRRARGGGARQRAAVRAQPARRRSVRDARRDRARGRVGARPRRAVRAHRAARPSGVDRLPHVRHPAAQRGARRARDEARGAVRREGARCRACGSAKGSSATRRCTASRCSCPTSRRIRATSSSCPTCDRSWRSRCCSRIAASASSISRARSSTRSASATSRS